MCIPISRKPPCRLWSPSATGCGAALFPVPHHASCCQTHCLLQGLSLRLTQPSDEGGPFGLRRVCTAAVTRIPAFLADQRVNVQVSRPLLTPGYLRTFAWFSQMRFASFGKFLWRSKRPELGCWGRMAPSCP